MNNQSENIISGSLQGMLSNLDYIDLASKEEKIKFQVTLELISHAHPGKILFSLKEVAEIFGVGQEFIRRRINNGTIKVDYFGDKPKVHITELAKITMKGLK